MNIITKILTLGVVGLGVAATTGVANADVRDRASIGIRIGNVAIGFTDYGYSRPWVREHRYWEPAPIVRYDRYDWRFRDRDYRGYRHDRH